MRLLRLISSMDPAQGGPPQGIRNITSALHDLGIITEIATVDAPDALWMAARAAKHPPEPVIHALGPATKLWAYSRQLLPWLKTNLPKYDAVIVHGLWQYPGYAIRKAVHALGASAPPYFIYPHGMLDPWFQLDPTRHLKAIRNRIYWRWFESRVVRDAEALLFTCEEEKRLAARTFDSYHPHQQLAVGYGVPEPPAATAEGHKRFLEACPGLPSRQSYLLFLSRIHAKKGVDLLIQAYAAWRNQRIAAGQGAHVPDLVIAGPGLNYPYGQKLQELATQLGLTSSQEPLKNTAGVSSTASFPANEPLASEIDSGAPPAFSPAALTSPADYQPLAAGEGRPPFRPSAVHFPGMLEGPAKWAAFQHCDAFILPSHQENFGISVVEALACGKPVMISDKVNICQEIKAAGAGWVRTDTLEGTKQLLELLMDNRNNPPSASVARACYLQHFGVEQAAMTLRDVLKRVLDERKQTKKQPN